MYNRTLRLVTAATFGGKTEVLTVRFKAKLHCNGLRWF
jgi:hypothetical protein